MSVELNHTIVWSSDKNHSAKFVADILGLPEPGSFGRFRVLELANGASLDFADREGPIARQHYAFLVSDEEFDAIFARIKEKGIRFWADPGQEQPGQINHRFGGRGVYFEGPDGHNLEALTAPYSEAEA